MLIVFTGDGKGKTTAALGCAMRALGQNKRVLMIQFIKGSWEAGEQIFPKKFYIPISKFQIISVGKGFVKIGDPAAQQAPHRELRFSAGQAGYGASKISFSAHKKAAQDALKLAQKAILSKKWDLIIFDEINVAVSLKLIKASDVLKILKPAHSDIILTGRGAPKIFMLHADLVTEMKEIKHPFQKGAAAKIGIEF